MHYDGVCRGGRCRLIITAPKPPHDYKPRVCDCGFCKAHPSALISDPELETEVVIEKGDLRVKHNGDRLASFYHCPDCDDLLAVGISIDGVVRGAVNSRLLNNQDALGEPVQVQPRLLSAENKVARWNDLWGVLRCNTQ